jgi:hypothetical protein
MHIWTDLLTREAALLAILLALGSGPAAFLSERFDGAARLALAPMLGFCLGTCVTTTVLEFVPAGQTYWMLIPLSLLSLSFAACRTHRSSRRAKRWMRLGPHELFQLLFVCIAVAGPLTYTLHERHTVGPVAFVYTDGDSYVSEQDGAQFTSIRDARHAWERSARTGARFADLTQWDWSFRAFFDANLDATPLDANANALLGLGATDTNSAFLIVLLLAGALGVFAALRYATRSPTWLAAIAGALFGGPLFLELWFDSFQAAIIALGLIMPFAVLGAEVLRSPRRAANLVLLALVVACMLTVYPVFIPILVVVAVLVLAWRGVGLRREGAKLRPLIPSVAARVAALVALIIAFDLVAFTRDIQYYRKILNNTLPLPRVDWHLPVEVLPGWLLQTREFWYLPSLSTGGLKQILIALVLPLVFIGFMVFGVRQHRPALALVALAGVCALVAEYSYASNQACTYCAERDLLPLGPIAIVLLALGLSTALAAPRRWTRALGFAGLLLLVLAVGQRTHVALSRFANGSYFLDSANRSVLAKLPKDARAVQLEGYGQTLSAQAEQPLVYHLSNERAHGKVSIVLGSNLNNAIQYLDFGPVKAPGPEFRADYDYVLTRFAAIQTNRRTVARSGAIALEQRTQSLDVLPYSGLEAPIARLDPSGSAWLQPELPLQLYVVGVARPPIWARLVFALVEPVTVPSQPGVRIGRRPGTLIACVPATGAGPVRQASLSVHGPPVAAPARGEQFAAPSPQEGIALVSMRAVSGACSV